MSETIWKFEADVDDHIEIDMPANAAVIHVDALSPTRLAFWAIVNPAGPVKTRCFQVRGTGHPLQPISGGHIATVRAGQFVWHVFGEADHPHTPEATRYPKETDR